MTQAIAIINAAGQVWWLWAIAAFSFYQACKVAFGARR